MENKLDQLIETLADVKKVMDELGEKVDIMEKRLDRLVKVDSIEHRVTSNQIDITDIKEALERMEESQSARIENTLREIVEELDIKNRNECKIIHKRLDSHLLKLGRVEEDILIIKEDN